MAYIVTMQEKRASEGNGFKQDEGGEVEEQAEGERAEVQVTQEELHGEDQGYTGDPTLENHEVEVIQTVDSSEGANLRQHNAVVPKP